MDAAELGRPLPEVSPNDTIVPRVRSASSPLKKVVAVVDGVHAFAIGKTHHLGREIRSLRIDDVVPIRLRIAARRARDLPLPKTLQATILAFVVFS